MVAAIIRTGGKHPKKEKIISCHQHAQDTSKVMYTSRATLRPPIILLVRGFPLFLVPSASPLPCCLAGTGVKNAVARAGKKIAAIGAYFIIICVY